MNTIQYNNNSHPKYSDCGGMLHEKKILSLRK